MDEIIYERLTAENFNANSLDSFIRHQEVTHCWRCIDGAWQLVPVAFTEDWDVLRCQQLAAEILEKIRSDWFAYGAFLEGALVGFLAVSTLRFGGKSQYMELVQLQVSAPMRKKGIAKRLFALAADAARALGAEKLYISAHSSAESQAAYRCLGCVHAEEINSVLAAQEPCDVQMEFVL